MIDCKSVVASVALALRTCHENNIVHCDVKLNNVFSTTVNFTNKSDIKLIDFGLAEFTMEDTITGFHGTKKYYAPETITQKNFNSKIDMWSLGVMAYLLITECYPYDGVDSKTLDKNFSPFFDEKLWDDELSKFVKLCLTVDPQLRISSQEAVKFSFVQEIINSEIKRLKENEEKLIRKLALQRDLLEKEESRLLVKNM